MTFELRNVPDDVGAASSRAAVFNDANINVTPFPDALGCRLLLHVIRPPLERSQWSALAATGRSVGDRHVFVECLLGPSETWSVPLRRFEAYEEIASYDDTAIWSPQGLWGMFISSDDYAIFGSSSRVITETVASKMPDLPRYEWDDEPFGENEPRTLPSWSQIDEFQRHWARLDKGATDTWSDGVLAHVRASAELCR